jgi:hypothetical protein
MLMQLVLNLWFVCACFRGLPPWCAYALVVRLNLPRLLTHRCHTILCNSTVVSIRRYTGRSLEWLANPSACWATGTQPTRVISHCMPSDVQRCVDRNNYVPHFTCLLKSILIDRFLSICVIVEKCMCFAKLLCILFIRLTVWARIAQSA